MIQKVYTEEWRPVVGYEGLYEVSSFGRVRSVDRFVRGRSGKPKPCKGIARKNELVGGGYYQVALCKDGKHNHCLVHRLVAEAFIPNPDNLPQVNHKDECKTNNAIWNLEWCGAKYNQGYGTCIERRAEKQKRGVVGTSIKDGSVIRFNSVREAMDNGFWYVIDCCKGIKTRYKGYIWSYA